MRRVLLTAVLLVLAFLAGRAAWLGLADDATRIRRQFHAQAAAFDAGSAGAATAPFLPDYVDETSGISLTQLRQGLLWLFLHRRDPATPQAGYRVELPDDALTVTVDGATARADFRLRLQRGTGADTRLVWEAEVAADLESLDGEWRIRRSRHRTLQGALPGR